MPHCQDVNDDIDASEHRTGPIYNFTCNSSIALVSAHQNKYFHKHYEYRVLNKLFYAGKLS